MSNRLMAPKHFASAVIAHHRIGIARSGDEDNFEERMGVLPFGGVIGIQSLIVDSDTATYVWTWVEWPGMSDLDAAIFLREVAGKLESSPPGRGSVTWSTGMLEGGEHTTIEIGGDAVTLPPQDVDGVAPYLVTLIGALEVS